MQLAPYAVQASRGRLIDEPPPRARSPFQRDRDRVVHCTAFRRLQHKTQVFVYHEGDHYRTRLTHSLEVAQIARSLARALKLDEDLTECLALAHDLGHPPFGHAGEDALDRAMLPFGGFDHNDQTVRVLTRLERRYAAFDGLNLTWETLEGVVKHNGPLPKPPPAIADLNARIDLRLDGWPSLEAQIAALSDDIAYLTHDLDDGLRAGLFGFEDVAPLPLFGPLLAAFPPLDPPRRTHELVRCAIDALIADLLSETRARLALLRPDCADAIRACGQPLAAFSVPMREDLEAIRRFLFERMYRHTYVNRATSKAKRVVGQLFQLFLAEPNVLPPDWRAQAGLAGAPDTARLVCDYIAGMTDRYAFDEHRKLFDLTAR